MTTIGITGAAGSLGGRTAQYLLAAHPADDVVLYSRSPESLTEFTDAGVSTRHADFDQPESLTAGFDGVDVLLLISTDAVGRRRAQHEAAITAAAAAGVGRIVYTSMPNADGIFPEQLRPLSDDHIATEKALRQAGPTWTILRNALYLDAIGAGWTQAAATGSLITNNGDGRHAPITRDDCAAAAAAVLTGDGHDNVVYDIAGAQLVDDAAVAAALTARYGRPVDVVCGERRSVRRRTAGRHRHADRSQSDCVGELPRRLVGINDAAWRTPSLWNKPLAASFELHCPPVHLS